MTDSDEQRTEIVHILDRKSMNCDRIFVKIKDKKECKALKELLKDRCKVVLNTGLFEIDKDVIISTSSIQNGQFIKENVLSIFVQTYIDNTSSVKQFLGVVVYVRYRKHMNKQN